MKGCISIVGSDIHASLSPEADKEVRIALSDETLSKLKSWADGYDRALRANDPLPLTAIGAKIFEWLDQSGWASAWAKGSGHRYLEIAVEDPDSAAANALLGLPWEILFCKGDFMAADPNQTYVVHRRIGPRTSPSAPTYRDLAVMFMAAAPEGVQELDFEAEEIAILTATERLPMQLWVEESGCAEFLKDRLSLEGPFEAVHLSCHGDIDRQIGPILALETPDGKIAPVAPGKIVSALGENQAPLVFLSACRTAERYTDNRDDESQSAIDSFVRSLVRAGVPNVLGWDGSVSDKDAIRFASAFYNELVQFASVPYAAAIARREVLREHRNDPQQGHHWHLARAYAGAQGGGAICDRAKEKRKLRKGAGFQEFLDKAAKRVPVATAQQFVGRRRLAQKVLGEFRKSDAKSGVLLFGMGHIGKSSLAARIANRMPRHKTVVIYDRYDAVAIFDRLLAALPGAERIQWEQQWRQRISQDNTRLGYALEDLLAGPLDDLPILLIIDDLEQILEEPKPGQHKTPIKDASGAADTWRRSLGGVLRAFAAASTASKLLLTSRYLFTLPDGQGQDLADLLLPCQLLPMAGEERTKQWQAATRTAGREQVPSVDDEAALVGRILEVAAGNPGLQEILCRHILAGELKVAGEALDAVAHWKASGRLPDEESAAQEFFRRVSFETYAKALTGTQHGLLRAATLFSEEVPIPLPALEAVGRAAGVSEPAAAIERLLGLGLMDSWPNTFQVEHLSVNPLARPLVKNRLSDPEKAHLAAAAISPLSRTWQDDEGDFPYDLRAVEAAQLAVIGNAPAAMIQKAAHSAGSYLFHREHNAKAALSIMQAAQAEMDAQGYPPTPGFLLLALNCAERIGERELQISFLERGLALESDDKIGLAQIAATYATQVLAHQHPEKALETLRKTAALFEQAKDAYSRAVTMGQIADILAQRGETDEALRIHIEERLPAAKSVKDLDSIAHIRFLCAQLRIYRGGIESGELQTIYEELSESFGIYLKLQRVDGVAYSGMLLGQVLAVGGMTDEALQVLDQSAAAFEKLQFTKQVETVRDLQKRILEKKQ